jgi:hypothetical protein
MIPSFLVLNFVKGSGFFSCCEVDFAGVKYCLQSSIYVEESKPRGFVNSKNTYQCLISLADMIFFHYRGAFILIKDALHELDITKLLFFFCTHLVDEVLFNIVIVNKESLSELWSFFLRKHLSAYLVTTYILGVSNFAALITLKPPRQWKIIMLGNRLNNGSVLAITNPVALLFSTCMGMRTCCFSQPLQYWMVLSMLSPVIVICR